MKEKSCSNNILIIWMSGKLFSVNYNLQIPHTYEIRLEGSCQQKHQLVKYSSKTLIKWLFWAVVMLWNIVVIEKWSQIELKKSKKKI